jgi:plasmid stabilization system protein ParE
MGVELKWTERASADIEAIVRYIARRDPEAASRIGLDIYDRAQQLIEQPKLGSVELSLPEGEWRKLLFRRWKIIYTLRENAIIIGRVWPCSMAEIDLDRPLDA